MGSGETAPTMVKVAPGASFDRLGAGASARGAPRHAVRLPGERRRDHASARWSTSRQSVRLADRGGRRSGSAGRRGRRPAAAGASAAGPRCARPTTCSPARAARPTRCDQWRGSGVAGSARRQAGRAAGAVMFASAAARHARPLQRCPVYEIYKVGAADQWLDGLDLLGPLGLRRGRRSRTTTTPRAAPTTPGSATWASGGSRPSRRCCRRTRSCSASTSTPRSCSTSTRPR